jgi:hypothetical protein
MNNNTVNRSVFDINPYDDSQDVSRTQILTEYAKYDGTKSNLQKNLQSVLNGQAQCASL